MVVVCETFTFPTGQNILNLVLSYTENNIKHILRILNREKDLKDCIQKEIILNEKQTREHLQKKTTIIFTENKFHFICSKI